MELTHFSYLSKGWTRGSFYCRRKFWRRMVPVKRGCHSVTWVCNTEPVQGYGFANYLNSSPEQKEMVNLEGRACPWDGSSVQFSHSVVSSSLWPHGLPHDRPPCPSPTPRVYSNSCPLNRWCHPTISSSVVPFSSCLQSFPASGSFPRSQFFASGDAKYWSFSFNISPSSEYSGLISFRMDWLALLAIQGTFMSLLQHHSSKTVGLFNKLWRPS